MLDPGDWNTAIDDARARHEAGVGLIYASDTQALALLSLFSTLGLAAAAGVAATIPAKAILPSPLGWCLVVSVLILSLASWHCFKALGKSAINLPGRGAEFWLWAAAAPDAREEVFRLYLSDLEEKQDLNRALNKRQTDHLGVAKLSATLTPLAALITGLLASHFQG
jgi:hypothetical protein